MAVAHLEMSESEVAQGKHLQAQQFLHQRNNVVDIYAVVEGGGGCQRFLYVFAGKCDNLITDFAHNILGGIAAM